MKKLFTLSIALLLNYLVQAQFYSNGGTLGISSGAILQVNNTFTNKSGSNLVNNGTLNVTGHLTNEQTMSNAYNGTLTLGGSSSQTVGGTAALLVKNLTFNNAAGISLSKSLRADGEVRFQSGIVAASSSAEPLAFTSNATVSTTNAPGNTSHVNGYVLREGTGAFDFPVGDGTRYQKVGANLTANGSGLLAKYNASDAGTGTFATTGASATALTSYNTQEHWDLSPLSTATGTVTIHWDDYKIPTLTDINLVKVAHKSGANWLNQGGTGTGSTGTGSVTSSSVSTWSPFTLGLTAAASGCPSGNTLYVNASVSGGTGDGSSWANAYAGLSNALAVAHACNVVKTIKVAQGTYKPTKKPFNAGAEMTTSNSRDITFHIPDGVTMEGGYDAAIGSRDITANVTILSGDLNNDDLVTGSGSTFSITGNGENAYHVVLASGSTGVTIDGFSIKGGYANAQNSTTVNGNAIKGYSGGGIYLHNGTNKIENNKLSGNAASKSSTGEAGEGAGGGIYINGGTNTLRYNTLNNNLSAGSGVSAYGGGVYVFQGTDNMISYNTVYNNNAYSGGGNGAGGGIYVRNSTNNTISNTTLYGNYAYGSNGGSGGGISISQGTNTVSNNTLYDNSVNGSGGAGGGGISISQGTNTISNNTLYNNTASASGGGSGGGIFISQGTNTISNNTLYNNTASANYYGGGGGISLGSSTNTLSNNIFWGNKKGSTPSAAVTGADVYTSSSTDTFKNNLMQLAESNYTSANNNALGAGASGNIFNQDPLFVAPLTPKGGDGIDRTADDGLAVQNNSPGVNTGTAGTGIPTTDITGAARVGNPDMGAYEAVCTTPTFSIAPPTHPTTCGNTNGSISLSGLTANTGYSVSYQKNGGTAVVGDISSNASGVLIITNLGAGNYTNITVTLGNCTGAPASVSLANPPSATASISGTTTVCQNAPNPVVTFTGANGTAPYTFTYRINGGAQQTLTTSGGSNSAAVLQTATAAGVFTYTLESVNDAQGCGQNQSGSATVTVQGKPTVSLNALQQTLNEGNNPVLCDTDANPVNSLQFTVSSSCVSGVPVWRVQVGSGPWSSWNTNAPSSQPSDNQTYRYQAACDTNCPNSFTTPISVTINYRASTPQNVTLTADGTTVAAGEEKSICDQTGNAITFNATCAANEVLLYSLDGGDYSSTPPTQIVDEQYHNYRVRCRKADGTPSCVETESGVMRLKISAIPSAPTASLNLTSGCGSPANFSGTANCGASTTVWYNATTNAALPNLPTTTPNQTTSYYARCQNEAGCLSEKSNTVTFTITPVNEAPVVTVSADLVCAGTEVTVATNCPAGTTVLWNTGVTESTFKVAFNNVTKATYSAKCISANGCQSPVSAAKTVFWKGFELTFINVGQSGSATKSNDRAAWASQFITPDAGPSLDYSTEANPTIYFSENVNKTAPRFWTIHAETCNLGTNGSLTFNLLATPELGVVRSYNTHENNAPYFMYANRAGFTELYAQNHPAYGFYQDNGSGGNVYDAGLPKGLYKLGVRYWDQKGQGSIYPSTRQPAGNVLAYQEYWFRIQSKDGIGTGAARITADNGQRITDNGAFAQVMPNPVSSVLRLKVSDAKAQKVNVTLTDASGRQVMGRSFVPETNQHQEEFNVSELANGIYFLKVNTSEKQAALKVVKVQ